MEAWDNVEGTVSGVPQLYDLQHSVHTAVGFFGGAPQRRDVGSGPGNGGETESRLKRGDAALVTGTTGEKFALRTFVEVAGQDQHTELETQESDANRSAFVAPVVDVHVCNSDVLARLVGSSAELAGDDHALKGPRRISVRAGTLTGGERAVTKPASS